MKESIPQASLQFGDAVAAIIIGENQSYLLQHRDEKQDIWYPGCWGCFGGAVDIGEKPLDALRRELFEEIRFEPEEISYFTKFDFDLTSVGLRQYYRIYYIVQIRQSQFEKISLHEGKAVEFYPGEKIFNELRVTPYDAFALFLYHNEHSFIQEQKRNV